MSPMPVSGEEILETIRMVQMESLDVRTVTLSLEVGDCAASSVKAVGDRIAKKVFKVAKQLVRTAKALESEFGIPIVNKRVALTPIAHVASAAREKDYTPIAKAMDRVAKDIGIDLIGGFGALVEKGFTVGAERLFDSIPHALASTDFVCSGVAVASTKAGINMDAVQRLGHIIKQCAELSKDRDGIAAGKLAVLCNAPTDIPFMAGAFHGFGEAEAVINVGVSGPSVMRSVIEQLPKDLPLQDVAEAIKKTSFKITRVGEVVGREMAKRLNVSFGIVDLSLAPTPHPGDSIAKILELMGLERVGTHGTTMALMMLVDAVKKGGVMATSSVGGFSGTFIPASEDHGMIEGVRVGSLTLDKLEAMTAVCSVGLDMVPVPGNTPPETLSAIIADEMAIGVVNNKSTGVRIIPVPGKRAGQWIEYGSLYPGLLARSPIMAVHPFHSTVLIRRGGRVPAPLRSLTN